MPDAVCPSCHARLVLPPVEPGKRIRCSACRNAFVPVAAPVPPPPLPRPQPANDFDFSGPSRPSRHDEDLDFRESDDEIDDANARRRAARPAASWLGIAGILYLFLSLLYILRMFCLLPYANGPFLFGSLVAAGLSAALAWLLRTGSHEMSRLGRRTSTAQVACIMALVVGCLVGLMGLCFLTLAIRMQVIIAQGAWFADGESVYILLGTGIALAGVATVSIIAGVKGLMVTDRR